MRERTTVALAARSRLRVAHLLDWSADDRSVPIGVRALWPFMTPSSSRTGWFPRIFFERRYGYPASGPPTCTRSAGGNCCCCRRRRSSRWRPQATPEWQRRPRVDAATRPASPVAGRALGVGPAAVPEGPRTPRSMAGGSCVSTTRCRPGVRQTGAIMVEAARPDLPEMSAATSGGAADRRGNSDRRAACRHVEDRHADVEADEGGERQRTIGGSSRASPASWPGGCRRPPSVREDRLVDHRHQ